MPRLLALLVLIAACEEPDSFQQSVDHFIDVACGGECVTDEAACRTETAADLAMAKMMLDADGLAHCKLCLDVRAFVIPDVEACVPNDEQNAKIYDACDLDPTMDYDRDTEPADDVTEACAGIL